MAPSSMLMHRLCTAFAAAGNEKNDQFILTTIGVARAFLASMHAPKMAEFRP
jgi:hypothetical protein